MFDIGFDIGGTNIAAGVVDESLQIVLRKSVRFPRGQSGGQVAELVAAMAKELVADSGLAPAELASVGVAIPGSLDGSESMVVDAYNLGFHNVPFKEQLAAHINAPIFLVNDANAAALAELYGGAFKGVSTAVLLTLGTGVGGGLVLGGRMFNGGNNSGVELGHMLLRYGQKHCTCGLNGCVEAYCAATWLVEQGRLAAEGGAKAILKRAGGNVGRVNAKTVIDCARAGDEKALAIFSEYIDNLGSTLASLVNLLDPEVIALGGGVGQAGEFLLEPLRKNLAPKCFFEYRGRVVAAKMGNDAGIVGAAMMRKNAAH